MIRRLEAGSCSGILLERLGPFRMLAPERAFKFVR